MDAHDGLGVEGLTKRYGDLLALDGLTFDVRPGELFGFVGSNGAGKTTTMRIILGVLAADSRPGRARRRTGRPRRTATDRLHAGRTRPVPEDEGR